MSTNQFFEKKGPFPLKEILNIIGYNDKILIKSDFKIHNFESLDKARENDLTFLNSSKYQTLSLKTNAAACITSPNLSKYLPKKCIKLNVKNVLFAVTQASKMFYPNADIDIPDVNLSKSEDMIKSYPNIKFGKNVFIGPFVEIQNNTVIGDNTRIQSHSFVCEKVTIGKNCFVGHGVMFTNDDLKKGKVTRDPKLFKKTKLGNNVVIGSNTTLLPVSIVSGTVIGAGSTVTRNINTKGIYAGSPAKLLRKI